MIVADTDVLIDYLRGHEPARTRVAGAIQLGTLATTAVSAFELLIGGRTARERKGVDELLAVMLAVLPLDEEAGRAAADVERSLGKKGQGIGMADCLIAGTCLAHSAPLLTRNRRHFARVDGLVLEDPAL